MKRMLIATLVVFTNFAFATAEKEAQLKLACVPQMPGMEEIPAPMVLHITLGSATVDGLNLTWQLGGEIADDFFLPADESQSTLALQINFSTHINQPGTSPAIPVQVSVKNQNLLLSANETDGALLPISSLKSILVDGATNNFSIMFAEKTQEMPFSCSIAK